MGENAKQWYLLILIGLFNLIATTASNSQIIIDIISDILRQNMRGVLSFILLECISLSLIQMLLHLSRVILTIHRKATGTEEDIALRRTVSNIQNTFLIVEAIIKAILLCNMGYTVNYTIFGMLIVAITNVIFIVYNTLLNKYGYSNADSRIDYILEQERYHNTKRYTRLSIIMFIWLMFTGGYFRVFMFDINAINNIIRIVA